MTGSRGLIPVFLGAEGALYAAFLYCDLFAPQVWTAPLKYAGIVLCFLMAAYCAARGGDRLLPWALGFTLGADLFLLVLDRDYTYGLAFFCLVQGVYLLRLHRAVPGRTRPGLRLALAAAALGGLLALGQLSPLTALGAVYITTFACNLLQSLSCPPPWGRLFAAGLGLYFLCDLCVGIFNAGALFPAPLWRFAAVGMWLFYLPGKVLITLSGHPKFLEKEAP